MLILSKTAIPINVIFLGGLTFVDFKGVLQDFLVLILHKAAISSVLHHYEITSVYRVLNIHFVVLRQFSVVQIIPNILASVKVSHP